MSEQQRVRWFCEAHRIWTTSDCPRCDDELIALHRPQAETEERSRAALASDPTHAQDADGGPWCRCSEVNGGEPIDWRTEKCRVCGLPVMAPGGGV